ncbi:hypothetical protein Vi05172_g1538 [Venturia inaequalis]|nr:hypothetical protein Vi05172_g1538 [Venturia inaequalis]
MQFATLLSFSLAAFFFAPTILAVSAAMAPTYVGILTRENSVTGTQIQVNHKTAAGAGKPQEVDRTDMPGVICNMQLRMYEMKIPTPNMIFSDEANLIDSLSPVAIHPTRMIIVFFMVSMNQIA